MPMETVDLDSLGLTYGDAKQLRGRVVPEDIHLGGQSYRPEPAEADFRLDVSRTSTGFALRLRFEVGLEGPCFRCLEPAVTTVTVDAREVDQPPQPVAVRPGTAEDDEEDEASAAELSRLQKDAEWATRRLKGFLEQEKVHKKEGERLHEQSEQNQIEDQTDELTQLEKMYREDELVDATEEIVLKRSRRGLARLRASIALQQLVRRYARELVEVIQQEGMEVDVAQKHAVVARQTRSAEQKAAGRKLDAEKTRTELDRQQLALARLRKDRDQMIVRAPRRGVALHGEPRAVPGSLRIERGAVLALRKTFMTVAEPGRFEVLTDLDEADIAKVRLGAAVEVVPSGIDDLELLGAVRVADLPTARDGNGNNLYEARVALEKTDPRLRFLMRCKVLIRQSVGSR